MRLPRRVREADGETCGQGKDTGIYRESDEVADERSAATLGVDGDIAFWSGR